MDNKVVVTVLELLGCTKIKTYSDYVLCACPFAPYTHHSKQDNHPSFGVKNDRYLCFGCKESGYFSRLVRNLERYNANILNKEKIQNLLHDYVPLLTVKDIPKYSSKIQYGNIESYRLFPKLKPNSLYNKEDIDRWELRYDAYKDMIMFPIFGPNNQLQYVLGRGLHDKTFHTYPSPLSVDTESRLYFFGQHLLSDTKRPTVLVEGPKDAIYTRRVYPNVLAFLGTAVPRKGTKLRTILKGLNGIILFFDNDEAGRRCKENVAKICENYCPVWEVTDYCGLNDPADIYNAGKLNEALASIKPI